MSLKDKLRSLIEATFTSKKAFISNQAMPCGQKINIQLPVETATTTWVAPQDGYLHVQGSRIIGLDLQVIPNGGSNVGVQTFWPVHSNSTEQEYIAFTMAVRKGQQTGIAVWCSNNSTINNAWFEPSIGSS